VTFFIVNPLLEVEILLARLFDNDDYLKQYLKDAFKYLLQPFKSWPLALEYAMRHFRFVASKTDDIQELIVQTVKFIDE
jgi:hypothetical protein